MQGNWQLLFEATVGHADLSDGIWLDLSAFLIHPLQAHSLCPFVCLESVVYSCFRQLMLLLRMADTIQREV